MSTLELFEGANFGTPRPSLVRARGFVERVHAYLDLDADGWDEYERGCERLANEAVTLGAYSVARALRWLTLPWPIGRMESLHFIDQTDGRVKAVAARWLARIERAALATPRGPA